MVTYYVNKDEIYKVSATVNCAVYDASGSTILTCDAGSIVTFKAPTAKIMLSDNNAALTCISETSGDLSGLSEHVNNSSIHVSAQEKANWNSMVDNIVTDHSKFEAHMADNTIHVSLEEADQFNALITYGEVIWDVNRMFGNSTDTWREFYAISALRQYFYEIDAAKGDTDPETGFNYSKKFMVPGLKIRYLRGVSDGYIPEPFWCTCTWKGGNIDWSWVPGTESITDDFSNPLKWMDDVPMNMMDLHLDNGSTDSDGNEVLHVTNAEKSSWNGAATNINSHLGDTDVHVTADEKATWNDAAPKNLGTANAIVITDADGNITVSTVISVAELNTLNNNLTNLATKLADLESRLAALETA